MMSRCQRALLGAVAAGVLCLPLLVATNASAAAAAKGNAAAGKKAFASEGCSGCHKTKDYPKGGEVGPDLSAVGKDKKPAEISAYIKKPKKDSVMPAFKGPAASLDNLTAYLGTQK